MSASGRAKFTPGNTEIGSATTGGDKGTEVTVCVQSKTTFYSKSKRAYHRCKATQRVATSMFMKFEMLVT